MKLNSIEEIIHDIRQGKMVILMDDEARENEGDLIIAAEKVTPEVINFMVTQARGLICLPLTGERCDFLGLHAMVKGNGSSFGTPFTVSIEAAEGVTTGISAADRAKTILTAVDPNSKPEDIVQPGHIFPLRAQPGGVLSRAGHTEAGIDLARMAGLIPAAAIVEILNEDGTMARRPDLERFAETHQLKMGTIADLIHYRMLHEKTVELVNKEKLVTEVGEFDCHIFRDAIQNDTHIALSMGNLDPEKPHLVRVQVADTLRDLLLAEKPESQSWSLQNSLKKVASEGEGVVLLLYADRLQPLWPAIDSFFGHKRPQRIPGQDKSGAYVVIGTGSQILRDLGVRKMRLLSTPVRYSGISGFDLEVVEYIPFTNEEMPKSK